MNVSTLSNKKALRERARNEVASSGTSVSYDWDESMLPKSTPGKKLTLKEARKRAVLVMEADKKKVMDYLKEKEQQQQKKMISSLCVLVFAIMVTMMAAFSFNGSDNLSAEILSASPSPMVVTHNVDWNNNNSKECINDKFDSIDDKFDGIADSIDDKFDSSDDGINHSIDGKFDSIDDGIDDSIGDKFGIDNRNSVDDDVEKFDSIDDGFDNLNTIDAGIDDITDDVVNLDGIKVDRKDYIGKDNEATKPSSTCTFLLTLIGKIIVQLLKFLWLFTRAAFQVVVFGITHPNFTMTVAFLGVALTLLWSSLTPTDDGIKDTTTAPMVTSNVTTTPEHVDAIDETDEVFKS